MKITTLTLGLASAIVLFMNACSGNNNNSTGVYSNIQDSATNLYIWDNQSPTVNSWQDAFNQCDTLVLNACSGWRLPTSAEMQTISNNGTYNTTLAHWTGEYWSNDAASAGAHDCFVVDGNTVLECSDNAPISYSCVHNP